MLVLEEKAAPGSDVNKGENEADLKGSHQELDKASVWGNDRSIEADRSRYFPDNDPQTRLGEEFFSQPCISLAKALLGKVRVQKYINTVGQHFWGEILLFSPIKLKLR